ncbi:hypothetical protein P692DRAFT_20879248 [Suillus brevipes Sb2]|nr:hypothetical protein P692DRAFT_20879248 [Suillus brevipes Sb2]
MDVDSGIPEPSSPQAPSSPLSCSHHETKESDAGVQSPIASSSTYLCVVFPPHPLPTSIMRPGQVPLHDGQPISLAQSRPALVPRQSLLRSPSAPQRKKADGQAVLVIPREDDDNTPMQDTPQGQSGVRGLYDDPDAGDELHHNPLLHTEERHSEDSGSDHGSSPSRTTREQLPRVQANMQSEYDAPPDAHKLYQNSHSEWFARLVMILVAVLHAKHHVSFRACALILFTINTILLGLRVLDATNPIPVTLHTIINRFDLQDRFTIYPICAGCHRIFSTDTPINALCPDCDSRLFKPISNRLFRRLTGQQSQRPPPACAVPIQLPSSLLADFLARGENEQACTSWKSRLTVPSELKDISDGEVWKTIQGPDQKPFFSDPDDNEELRIGVTMSLDWYILIYLLIFYQINVIRFGRKTSVYGPSHSSGVLSLCVSNLPRALRYRAENLLVCFMTPRPKEPTGQQLQNYMKFIMDDLLKLYNDGIIFHTPAYPQGRRVRLILLGVVCDHPAMCKLSGFADHSHNTAPCSKCTVSQEDLFSDQSLRNEFPPHSGQDHRQRCYEDHALSDDKEHTVFFKEHGARWTELARLHYFDLVQHTIIHPMHNLLLGIVKAQWYSQWILTPSLRASTDTRGRELDMIHKFLASFEAPLWAGKLPLRVGEPAGGSLTADEYKFAVITAWPIIVSSFIILQYN